MGKDNQGTTDQSGRTDVRFDFVDKLPADVPPLEQQPSSLFPYPPPVGPAEATYYFPIPLGKLPPSNPTGVFFPSGYSFPNTIDVLLYFHGFKLGEFKTINQYWKGTLHKIALRENVNASGKSLVLIAPTLGESPGSANTADMGVFGQAGGGDDFLAEVVKWIGKYVPQYKANNVTPSIGNLVLAGHSGAGVILDIQARSMKAVIKEIWGFDSMYSQKKGFDRDVVADWITAAKARLTTKFFFHWGTSGPDSNAQSLDEQARKAGLMNIKILEAIHNHFGVLTTNFLKRLQAATCFS